MPATGTARTQVNRQPVRAGPTWPTPCSVTVFSPDDLDLVQEGPAGRRDYLDDVLVDRHPRFERSSPRSTGSCASGRGAAPGREPARRRHRAPPSTCGTTGWPRPARNWPPPARRWSASSPLWCRPAYEHLAGRSEPVTLGVPPVVGRRSWPTPWRPAGPRTATPGHLGGSPSRRPGDRQCGPGPARTHASQGEQRCVALALRLATHELRRAETARAPGAAPRRRVLRARRPAVRLPRRGTARRPGAPDHGRRPARRRSTPDRVVEVAAGRCRPSAARP